NWISATFNPQLVDEDGWRLRGLVGCRDEPVDPTISAEPERALAVTVRGGDFAPQSIGRRVVPDRATLRIQPINPASMSQVNASEQVFGDRDNVVGGEPLLGGVVDEARFVCACV